MASLEERINELSKGSVLHSPIWLARLIEEIFDTSWMKGNIGASVTGNNHWPLVSNLATPLQSSHSSWSSGGLRSKPDINSLLKFLSPQGTLFTALRQSADAWVSVSFDAKLAQSDSVRIATGIATIMRQPKMAQTDMTYRSQQRPYDSQPGSDQACMITLPVPHYFILRLISYMTAPEVIEALNKLWIENNPVHYQGSSPHFNKGMGFPIPSCLYADLVDSYCDYLLSNARQPPGTTLVSSRSLCADLARLYIQAVADFWLTPFASPVENSSMTFATSVSMPPPLLLQFVRRFLKRYFFNSADEWSGSNLIGQSVRTTSFSALRQPLLSFLCSCATHWPLNTTFGHVVSCWRAVVLPWHSLKRFSTGTSPPNMTVWESFVSENLVFYSEILLTPLILHLTRANVACPAYAGAVLRLAKVFGGAPDTDALVKLLIRLSSSASINTSAWTTSINPTTPSLSRSAPTQYCFGSGAIVGAINQLIVVIDSVVTSSTSCSNTTKELLRNGKAILSGAFHAGHSASDSFIGETMNKTPSFGGAPIDKSKESAGRMPKFRQVPQRQQSFSGFGRVPENCGEPDFRSSDIPIVLRLQSLIGSFLQAHGLVPRQGRAGTLYNAARFRWMADRREVAFLGVFLMFTYLMLPYPAFIFLSVFYCVCRTFLSSAVAGLQEMAYGGFSANRPGKSSPNVSTGNRSANRNNGLSSSISENPVSAGNGTGHFHHD